ncbi:MAG: hypothetical protein HOE30_18245 [Deltaproteobacteria bacterium]|nr:hypothetical protein [Deltaproteobacteria bacterium]
MEKCPNCKADFKGERGCYRCGFDFHYSLLCEAESTSNRQKAIRCLTQGEDDNALGFVEKACFYENHELNTRLKSLILFKNLYNGQEKEA